jgi:hypothetical protein
LAKAYEIKVWCYWEHFGEQIEDLIGTFGNLIEKEKIPPSKICAEFSAKESNNSPFFFSSPTGKFLPQENTHTRTHTHWSKCHPKFFFYEIGGFLSEKWENLYGTFRFKNLIVLMLTKFHTKKNNKLCN